MGNGNIDVGNKTATRKPGQPAIEGMARSGSSELRIDQPNSLPNLLKTQRSTNGAAMSLQCGESDRGNDSAPQKFVQLVGCRDPNARSGTWVRPRPDLAKQ